jgi:hypothetical protein
MPFGWSDRANALPVTERASIGTGVVAGVVERPAEAAAATHRRVGRQPEVPAGCVHERRVQHDGALDEARVAAENDVAADEAGAGGSRLIGLNLAMPATLRSGS